MEPTNDASVQLLNALKALKDGKLDVRLSAEQSGIDQEIAETFNSFMEQTSQLIGEMNRLNREIAFEGKLGGWSGVKGLSGAWKELQENMNEVEWVVTGQVRGVSGAVAAALEKHELLPDYNYPRNEITAMFAMTQDLLQGISPKREPAI